MVAPTDRTNDRSAERNRLGVPESGWDRDSATGGLGPVAGKIGQRSDHTNTAVELRPQMGVAGFELETFIAD